MKSVVCFGDSNTWGFTPGTGKRYPKGVRWTSVLQQLLGAEVEVIEEGLNGRTTVWNDPIDADNDMNKNGKAYFGPCLKSHYPLDLVIIMLGTNDLKVRYSLTAEDIAKGAGRLAKLANVSDCGIGGKAPLVLLVAPPVVSGAIIKSQYGQNFGHLSSHERSKEFSRHYAAVAKENKVFFLDAGLIVTSSDIDAIHLEEGEHKKLAGAIAIKVREILG